MYAATVDTSPLRTGPQGLTGHPACLTQEVLISAMSTRNILAAIKISDAPMFLLLLSSQITIICGAEDGTQSLVHAK